MATSYIRMKPSSWTQAIRSDLDPRYGPGRKLSANCQPDEFLLSDGTHLTDHLINLAFMEGEPTAADDTPLERGVGQLFFTSSGYVHGWYFSPSRSYSAIWDQVLNGGYADCTIDLHVGPVNYDGGDPVWNISQPLFIDDATVHFTRKSNTPDDLQRPKKKGLFGNR
jgi:hypothetical protein